MNNLNDARDKILQIDKEIACLFEKRMNLVKTISEYKTEYSLPIFDPKREAELIKNISACIKNSEIREYYILLEKNIIGCSRKYQHRLFSGMNVAYSGIEGAFAAIAAEEIFPDSNRKSYPDFESAYLSVVKGECDCVALPIENSYAGEVGAVLDLIFTGELYITGMFDLSVTQNLLGLPDSQISDIKKVISHSHALVQCEKYIRQNGFETENEVNTAVAAKKIAENGDKTVAAIASKKTAELYGLKLLAENINSENINTTKFAILSRALPNINSDDEYNSAVMFTVSHEAGSLANAISIIGKYGYNMCTLCSRPRKSLQWNYYFYVEVNGNLNTKNGQNMMSELKRYCSALKLIGIYKHINCLETEAENYGNKG